MSKVNVNNYDHHNRDTTGLDVVVYDAVMRGSNTLTNNTGTASQPLFEGFNTFLSSTGDVEFDQVDTFTFNTAGTYIADFNFRLDISPGGKVQLLNDGTSVDKTNWNSGIVGTGTDDMKSYRAQIVLEAEEGNTWRPIITNTTNIDAWISDISGYLKIIKK